MTIHEYNHRFWPDLRALIVILCNISVGLWNPLRIYLGICHLPFGNGEVGAKQSGLHGQTWSIPKKILLTYIRILIVGDDHIFGYRLLFYVIYQLDLEIHQGFIWEFDTYNYYLATLTILDHETCTWCRSRRRILIQIEAYQGKSPLSELPTDKSPRR